MTDHLTENARLRAALENLTGIVEGIDGAMNHGTWRDDNGMRLKDTPQWVAAYIALATPAPDAVQEAVRVPEIAALIEALKGMEYACEQLAATRPREAYLAMIDGGQADALLALDARRQSARAALRAIAGGQP